MRVELLVDTFVKEIEVEAASAANHGELLFLAEPQHIDFFTKVRFNVDSHSHKIYLERGLLFYTEADAILFATSFLTRGTD